MAITARVGNAGDFEAVVPMMREHRRRQEEFDPALYALHPDAEQRFRRWAGDAAAGDARSTLLVAEEAGRIVGFLLATIERDPPIYLRAEHALVREWWVERAVRGRGAGRALIELAAAELARGGIRQIRTRTAAPDAEARDALSRCGFRPGGSEMVMELRPPADARGENQT